MHCPWAVVTTVIAALGVYCLAFAVMEMFRAHWPERWWALLANGTLVAVVTMTLALRVERMC